MGINGGSIKECEIYCASDGAVLRRGSEEERYVRAPEIMVCKIEKSDQYDEVHRGLDHSAFHRVGG